MNIIKVGKASNSKGEFYFVCNKCKSEWRADRGDEGFSISPPGFPFYVMMKCPVCGASTIDEAHKNNI